MKRELDNKEEQVTRYKRATDKDIKKLSKSEVRTQIVYLEDLEKLGIEDQEKLFEDIFDKIYEGRDIDSLKKYALRCIKLSCDPKDNKIHLPYGVVVQKKDNKLIIKVSNDKNIFLLFLLITLLFLAILGSSYSAISYSIIKNLNKDITGDGISDINLDLNGDKTAEVNIDTNKDNKPDLNIDYEGNRKAVFNVDTDDNGVPDFNKTNQDLNKDGICDLNCDKDGDGWPDYNLDLDGDGKVDINKDTDGDKKPDMNFDTDKDGVCDLHCDVDDDNICDKYCVENPSQLPNDESESDSSPNQSTTAPQHDENDVTGPKVSLASGKLELEYVDGETVYITDIYPDDQPYFNSNIPTKKFKITNVSDITLEYNLKWVVNFNDYESENFKYKLSSTMGGASLDWTTAPKTTSPIATKITIAPKTTQEYSVDFVLKGVSGKQNYDQGKTFAGYVDIYLDDSSTDNN